MKTAISIPDKLFDAVDRYAKTHGYSRSQLFAEAADLYLKQHPADQITQKLNEVYSAESAELDQALATMQSGSIEQEEW